MFNVPYLTSCNHCREKKRRCDGKRPTCSLCQSHGVPCEYRRSRRFRKNKPGMDQPPAHSMPMANILPIPAHSSTPGGAANGGINGHAPLSFAPVSSGLPVYMPQVTQAPLQQQQPSLGAYEANYEVNAFTQLLSGDMYPLTQQLPQPILQGVNNFMSPFSNPRSQTIPEWVSQQKPGAAVISNLESLASAYQETPLTPMRSAATSDNDALLGNLTSQIMYGGNIGPGVVAQPGPATPFASTPQQQQPMVGVRPPQSTNAFSIQGLLAPATTAAMASQAVSGQQMYQPAAFGDLGGLPLPYGGNRRSSSLRSGGSQDSDAHARVATPGGTMGRMYAAMQPPNGRSPSLGASSDTPLAPNSASSCDRPRAKRPALNGAAAAHESKYPEDFVPEIIRTYASEFPAELSPSVLLKVMRGIYGSTRTSLVNVDIELSWFMILKGIIPRILLFAYIASMARGQVVSAELVHQLPANFDEICYDVAVRDVPLAVQSPSLWSALSLYLLGRYEFQSSRYDLMMQHYEMAADVLAKTTFHGHAFPWTGVPSSLKRTFEYDYYVYTFWVGFQWHLVSCFSLDRPFALNLDPKALPQAASNGAYFSPDLPCEIDLLTLVPANSWPQSAQSPGPSSSVWFRGFNDPEFSGWRPAEWRKITPNYKITAYLQRMLPLGAHLYRIQREYCEGRRTLPSYLQLLQSQQELLKRWMYSLPKEFEITQEKVMRLTRAAFSPATHGEDANLIMDFKELVMTYGLYNTFLIRANRVALLGMLGENLGAPATTMHTQAFGLRDYIEAVDLGLGNTQAGWFGTTTADGGSGSGSGSGGESSVWERNMMFHRCRMQCYESIDILCNVVQLSFMLRLNLFSYGTTYVAIAGEVLSMLVGQMGIRDRASMRKTKMRLGHVLCLLRSLQHWAPAIYMFANGIQALSDPKLVLEVDEDKMLELARKQKPDEQQRIAGILGADSQQSQHQQKQHQLQQQQLNADAKNNASPSNPFPPNHIINLIVDDLDSTLTTFLAPAYPMLLLKIFASSSSGHV
ncbi:hypothetical protein LPJ53_001734 [Coemansia erecta]|uniref:Zn(2)-C6 fungal-type domain-containing protein n=1 Tax=Coemansia erecta TaxID=147472 RepID=A0A9W7Y4B8_9FUNG|nr:hypothetical protein LPJ53_001734 [Coemansia erecta]